MAEPSILLLILFVLFILWLNKYINIYIYMTKDPKPSSLRRKCPGCEGLLASSPRLRGVVIRCVFIAEAKAALQWAFRDLPFALHGLF